MPCYATFQHLSMLVMGPAWQSGACIFEHVTVRYFNMLKHTDTGKKSPTKLDSLMLFLRLKI